MTLFLFGLKDLPSKSMMTNICNTVSLYIYRDMELVNILISNNHHFCISRLIMGLI